MFTRISALVLLIFRQPLIFFSGKVLKVGIFADKLQGDFAGLAITILGDIHIRDIPFFQRTVLIAINSQRTPQQHYYVRILLDCTRITKIREFRPFILIAAQR